MMHVYGLFICVYLSSNVGRPAAARVILEFSVSWRRWGFERRMWGDAGDGWRRAAGCFLLPTHRRGRETSTGGQSLHTEHEKQPPRRLWGPGTMLVQALCSWYQPHPRPAASDGHRQSQSQIRPCLRPLSVTTSQRADVARTRKHSHSFLCFLMYV